MFIAAVDISPIDSRTERVAFEITDIEIGNVTSFDSSFQRAEVEGHICTWVHHHADLKVKSSVASHGHCVQVIWQCDLQGSCHRMYHIGPIFFRLLKR